MAELAYSVSTYELPANAEWKDIDAIPADLRRIVSIYNGALHDNVEGRTPPIEDLCEFYECYDNIAGQEVVVARDEETIVGVASYDMDRNPPFFEGIAVSPTYRGKGIAGKLVSYVLHAAANQGANEMICRSQPSSVEANKRILEKSGYDFILDRNYTFPRFTVQL